MNCPHCQLPVESGVRQEDGTYHFKCYSTKRYQDRLAEFIEAFPFIGKLAREKLCKKKYSMHIGKPIIVVCLSWETEDYEMHSFIDMEGFREFLSSCDMNLYSIADGDIYINGVPNDLSLKNENNFVEQKK